ncbi:MAG TPA: hypothetical protein VK308_15985, partial [Pyrinomonadaceae bacterium]|nr:hypothetical protein [Pyrinomonadaceae bacterium]
MKTFKDKSPAISLALAALAAVFISVIGLFGNRFLTALLELVMPPDAAFTWWKAVILIFISLTVGGLVEKFSLKRVLPRALGFIAVWFVASVISAQFLNFSLMFVPGTLTVLLALFIVHLKTLWVIDSALTEKLVVLASTGHLLEGQSADLRIESGLRLLESVLPLSEAIVFRYTIESELKPIGRARSDKNLDSAVERQSSWRENVGLCEEALSRQQTVVQTVEGKNGAARVALPLVYEDIS